MVVEWAADTVSMETVIYRTEVDLDIKMDTDFLASEKRTGSSHLRDEILKTEFRDRISVECIPEVPWDYPNV